MSLGADEIRQLINEKQQRLHLLEVKRARRGFNTDPGDIIEIEEIERELEKLNIELNEAINNPQPNPARSNATPFSTTNAPMPSIPSPVSQDFGSGLSLMITISVALIFFVLVGLGYLLFDNITGSARPAPTQPVFIPNFTPTRQPTLVLETPTAAPTGPQLEAIHFVEHYTPATVVPDETLNRFPAGVSEVHAVFEYRGMSNGLPWEKVITVDGAERLREAEQWRQGSSGVFDYTIDGGDQPLPAGAYRLELYVDGAMMQTGHFTIE